MKEISDKLAAIATELGLAYIREMTLSESDINVHYKKTDLDLMMFIGGTSITTQFLGAQQVDVHASEIYFLTKKPQVDLIGSEVDDLLSITKRHADQTYYKLQAGNDTAIDIDIYTLEPVEIMTDAYAGHVMAIGIPLNNDGC